MRSMVEPPWITLRDSPWMVPRFWNCSWFWISIYSWRILSGMFLCWFTSLDSSIALLSALSFWDTAARGPLLDLELPASYRYAQTASCSLAAEFWLIWETFKEEWAPLPEFTLWLWSILYSVIWFSIAVPLLSQTTAWLLRPKSYFTFEVC